MQFMQNAFLNKVHNSMPSDEPIQLAQTPNELLQSGLENSGLKNIYETKFIVWNTEWSVVDWTIFCIVIAVIIVGVLIGLLFCCCIGSTEQQELKEAREKAEMDAKNMDYMEYMQGKESLAALGMAGEAPPEGGDGM